ncbi:unnamed protein product [Dibothriocephalus latus]|uniref:Thioredoxin-like fold domain-containing protein n=1 Tax=Dibothriocephalus latus TaxID=60516 RepID=A0A3P7M3B0_DIBLA|nr:unnamed protein product [Dibothriocephalus latus]
MKWFDGKLSDCIKDVKINRHLLFVFSKDESSPSSDSVLETLNEVWPEEICNDTNCLLLTADSDGYKQFTAIYAAQSLPCMHLILPSGGILGVKTSDFAPEQLSSWLKENVKKFDPSVSCPRRFKDLVKLTDQQWFFDFVLASAVVCVTLCALQFASFATVLPPHTTSANQKYAENAQG